MRVPNGEIVDSQGNLVKPEGGISQTDIQTALAFNNGLIMLTLTRAELVALLEHGVGALPRVSGRFPQVSGLRFSYDPDQPAGDRILSAAIVDEASGEVISELVRNGDLAGDADQTFRVVTLNFLAGGGDGYPFPIGPEANRVDLYDLDADGVVDEALTGLASFASDGTEQDTLAEYLATFFPADDDPGTPAYGEADQGRLLDERIQNLNVKEIDSVFTGDTISGGPGSSRDTLEGTARDDLLDGLGAWDTISGGMGNDTIIGGPGVDTLSGDEGARHVCVQRPQRCP